MFDGGPKVRQLLTTPATASTASWLHLRVKGSNRQINGSNLVWVYPPKAKTCHGVMTSARPYLSGARMETPLEVS